MYTFCKSLYVINVGASYNITIGTPYIFYIYMIKCGWLGCGKELLVLLLLLKEIGSTRLGESDLCKAGRERYMQGRKRAIYARVQEKRFTPYQCADLNRTIPANRKK